MKRENICKFGKLAELTHLGHDLHTLCQRNLSAQARKPPPTKYQIQTPVHALPFFLIRHVQPPLGAEDRSIVAVYTLISLHRPDRDTDLGVLGNDTPVDECVGLGA